jgi:glycosyltransferase involved in cell wall biosynthesis
MISDQVSILIAVHNEEKNIVNCLKSIQNINYKNLEIIIVDDGSSDSTANLIKEYKSYNLNIKLFLLPKQGLSKSLNYGLSKCSSKYIARLDADDKIMPNRISQQYIFLKNNPEYSLVGTRALIKKGFLKYHSTNYNLNDDCKSELVFSNCFYHPSVMFKKADFIEVGGYNEEIKYGEDYDLWTRLAVNKKIHNLNQTGIIYHIHENQMSNKIPQTIKSNDFIVMQKNYLKSIFFKDEPFCEADLNIHYQISMLSSKCDNYFANEIKLNNALNWIDNLIKKNIQNKFINQKSFIKIIKYYLFFIFVDASSLGYKYFKKFFHKMKFYELNFLTIIIIFVLYLFQIKNPNFKKIIMIIYKRIK